MTPNIAPKLTPLLVVLGVTYWLMKSKNTLIVTYLSLRVSLNLGEVVEN